MSKSLFPTTTAEVVAYLETLPEDAEFNPVSPYRCPIAALCTSRGIESPNINTWDFSGVVDGEEYEVECSDELAALQRRWFSVNSPLAGMTVAQLLVVARGTEGGE